MSWRDFNGQTGTAQPVDSGSGDSGLLWFFGPNNWEMLVKVVDGCDFNEHFWVFAASTTNVEYSLVVTDTLTGNERTYFNPLGTSARAIADTSALGGCGDAAASNVVSAVVPEIPAWAFSEGPSPATKVGSCEGLCLNNERFLVEVEWRDFVGTTGIGHAVPFRSDNSGLFWFFGPSNWEMLVKVIDGCGFNGNFWIFAAATTNVEYTLRVTDTTTGVMKTYFNPLGTAAAAVTDTEALGVCEGV